MAPMSAFMRLSTWQGNPWYAGRLGTGAMGRLHRLAARHALAGRFGRVAWAVRLLLTLTWPPRLAFHGVPLLRRFGPEVRARHGRPVARQAIDIVHLGLAYGLPPLAYYRYRLFLPEVRAIRGELLFDHEAAALFPVLNGFHSDPAVEDKRRFAERCAEAGLPCVPTLAWGEGGHVRAVAADLPAGDLVSKPAAGCRGRGVVLWRLLASGLYAADGAPPLRRDELPAALARGYGGEGWLLQPALATHPELADLTPGPLVIVRIVTGRGADGACVAFAAVLKMPYGRQPTGAHGLGAAVDLERGVLGPAFSYRPLHPGLDNHPDTGAAITGRSVPDWAPALRLAERAHARFPRIRLLGWDVALTPSGPVLLETNAAWDVAMPQIAAREPLGRTRLPELCG